MIRLSPGSPRKKGPRPASKQSAARLEPGGSGPSQPADERSPAGGKRGGTAVRPRGSGRVVLAAQALPRRTATMVVYPRTGGTEVPAQPDFPALEREVLDYWDASDTFR